MNIMNFMNLFSSIWKRNKKKACFFIFYWLWKAIFGSLTFIWFINYAMRSVIGVFIGSEGRFISLLMNVMKFYEVTVFKRFFLIDVFGCVELMNLILGSTSLMFIKDGGLYG